MSKGLLNLMGETAHLKAELVRVTAERDAIQVAYNNMERKLASYGNQIMDLDNIIDGAVESTTKAITASARRRTIPIDEIAALMEEIGGERLAISYYQKVKNPNLNEEFKETLGMIADKVAEIKRFDEAINIKRLLKEDDKYKLADAARQAIIDSQDKEADIRLVELYEYLYMTTKDAYETKHGETFVSEG